MWRLYLLRAFYLLIALGQGLQKWPQLIHHTATWGFWDGVGASMLGALAFLCLLAVRYPLQMLPLMLYELTWKTFWILSVALPLWSAHTVDAVTMENTIAI